MQFGVQILDRFTGTTYPDRAIINTLLRIQIYFEEVEIYNWFKSIQERNVDTETEMNEIFIIARRLHGPSTTTQWMMDERARCIL